MLYKAMQVKEIPIIFRGSVNGGSYPEPLIDIDISAFNYSTDSNASTSWVSQNVVYGNLLQYDRLYFAINDSYIGYKDKWIYTINANTHIAYFRFLDIPFAVTQSVENPGTPPWFSVKTGSNTPINLKIWTVDPTILIPNKQLFSAELTGNGQIKRFHARFACGENGTLHINPYVILNGNITVNLCDFAKEGENYISGDNEDFTFECYVPIETHAILYVEAENVGEYDSMLDVAIVVQYEDFIEEETIVGYEGINLGRKRR